MPKKKKLILIRWFKQLTNKDVALVGGKNASLGEMYRNLTQKGVDIPNGYAITAQAYFYLLKEAKIQKRIKEILKDLNTHDIRNLKAHGQAVRQTIMEAEFPEDLKKAIIKNYQKLEQEYGKNVDVAVRSSATAEDLPDASFAGQQETYLNIRGTEALLAACKKCFASLFTDRAISYREDKHFSHFTVGLSISVQKMVRSDKAASGVMFSIDTETGFKDVVLINSSYGLGENIVQGKVNPDEFYVHKPTLLAGHKSIISKKLGQKRLRMIYSTGKNPTKDVPVPKSERDQFSITDKEVMQLAKWSIIIEDHYSKKAGHFKPMDMEWAKDGITGKLAITQARPETVQSQKDTSVLEDYQLKKKGQVLVKGAPVGEKIGSGKVKVINSVKDIFKFKPGEVLVTDMTDPDWEPIMKIAAAIVTNKGGRTCHAAIVSRELGIPCIVGTEEATKKLKTGMDVTISCAGSEEGLVYKGILPFHIKRVNIGKLKRPKTQIKMIIGTPELAFSSAQIPNDGVGLAREEFIIASSIQIHPMALINYNKLKDRAAKAQINKLTAGYTNKKQYYVDKLAYGMGTICAAFYPKEVIVRLADFKSNEYANLIGGREFEPEEENPMLGLRGASRYYDDSYKAAFDLECKALVKVREEMGMKNMKLMIPFCRTIEEAKIVKKILAEHGLKKGKDGLEIYVMCEIPSNVVLAEQFADEFDGFSIGSNDLTQLTLGLDRDSALISHVGDENNEAIKRLVEQVIKIAKKKKKVIGICGQAPSDFPEFARFLVENKIDSISLNPDVVVKTTIDVAGFEKKKR